MGGCRRRMRGRARRGVWNLRRRHRPTRPAGYRCRRSPKVPAYTCPLPRPPRSLAPSHLSGGGRPLRAPEAVDHVSRSHLSIFIYFGPRNFTLLFNEFTAVQSTSLSRDAGKSDVPLPVGTRPMAS
ncbi:hypothetical protein EVAR_91523_1 [Eumeta japonica]|uniref:Uncharacterized protein n=1 Tax=Eumeta variegata TaxID=151549 RepID=A0A4C1VCE6_EUMVA|nr:hypothetical protein EVAR_91523_1 [Eumeta japonica]